MINLKCIVNSPDDCITCPSVIQIYNRVRIWYHFKDCRCCVMIVVNQVAYGYFHSLLRFI
jgi:hypothetical protein